MNYVWELWTGGIQYYIIIILIVIVFAILKDRYDATGTIFDRQRWSLYDFLIWTILFSIYAILIQLLAKWSLLHTTTFWILNFFSFYAIFKLKLRQNLSILGLIKRDLLVNVLYGIKVILVVDILLLGMIFLTPDPSKYLRRIHGAYTDWNLYQDSLSPIVLLISIYIVIAPFTEELIRGLMYSPFRRKVGKWGGILVTSTIFALYHGYWFSLILVMYAYIYEKRQSLVSSIAAHAFYNLGSVTLFLYTADFFNIGYKVNYRSYLGVTLLIYVAIYITISLFLRAQKKRVIVLGL